MKLQRKWIVLGVLLAVIIAIRAIAPSVIRSQANKFLAEFSPDYKLYIGDVDLSVFRMAYRFEGIEGTLKKTNENFLKIESVDVSMAWRELLRLRFLTDIEIVGARSLVTDRAIAAVKGSERPPEKDATEVRDKLFPVDVERMVLRDSSVQLADVKGVPQEKRWELADLQARVSNLTPPDAKSKTLVTFQGTFQGAAKIKGVAEALMKAEPLAWDVDLEMRALDLPQLNPVLKRVLPLTFTRGTMDLFLEAQSKNGEMKGYAKPYFRKIDVMGTQDFVGPKHFFIELAGAVGNLVLRRSGEHSVATKIPFRTEAGVFKVDTAAAIANAFEHGFDEKISPSLEESLSL